MKKNLIIDGIHFNLWTPQKEVADFQPIIKEHAIDIFGENSLYFDITPELRSNAGIGSKPDGFVVVFNEPPKFYVIEVERAEHGVHDHVVTQISKFNSAFKKPETKTKIVRTLYENILNDPQKLTFTKLRIRDELYKFLIELVSEPPTVIVVIDELMDELIEAVEELPLKAELVEFQTFKRADAPTVHAHLFSPLFNAFEDQKLPPELKPFLSVSNQETIMEAKQGSSIEIQLLVPSERKYAAFHLEKNIRRFFPGYKIEFVIETDIGEVRTNVINASGEAETGDPVAGRYIRNGLFSWYKNHPNVNIGSKVRFECIEPYKRYKLSVV